MTDFSLHVKQINDTLCIENTVPQGKNAVCDILATIHVVVVVVAAA